MGGLTDLTSRVALGISGKYCPTRASRTPRSNGKIYGVPSFAFVQLDVLPARLV